MVFDMKIIFVILCMFFNVFSVFSKQENKDESHNNININEFLISTDNIRTKDFLKYSDNLKKLSELQNKFTTYQKCYFDFLAIYKLSLLGDFDLAKTNLQELFNQCNDLKIQIRIKALLSNLYVISGNYYKAITDIDFVVSQIGQIKDNSTKYYAYTAASLVYDSLEQWDLSYKFSELLLNDSPSEEYICKGGVYKYAAVIKLKKQGDFNNKIKEIIKKCFKVDEIVYAQGLNTTWLKYQLDATKSDEEINNLLTSLIQADKQIENTNYKNLIGVKNSLFAEMYEKLDISEQALKYANLALEGSISIGTTEHKIDALQVLINHHQNTLDYKSTNQYLLEKNKAEKKLYSDKQAKLMAYQTVKHDSLAKTHQITSLNQRNVLLSLENKLAEESKNSQRLINVLLGILLLVFLFLIYRIRKQQQQYKKLSELDHMTLIYNRKGARDAMDYLLPYSENKNEVIAYGIFDLDKFKTINDEFGHLTGDWVIKTVVEVCQKLNNSKATFARLGGEEFSITIRDSSLDEIKQFSEECRLAIYGVNTLTETGHDFQISASFGITTTEISGYDYLMLMKHADTALYASKNNGRNQISIFEK
jgi:diguanylate cyclase (GGDEF)-like protein